MNVDKLYDILLQWSMACCVPLWFRFQGTVEGLDYADEMPVKVTLKHPKGVCGYAVCDLLRVASTETYRKAM